MPWHAEAEWAVVVSKRMGHILWVVSWHESEADAKRRLAPVQGTDHLRKFRATG
jgi:hypothetical protein